MLNLPYLAVTVLAFIAYFYEPTVRSELTASLELILTMSIKIASND